MYRQGLKQVRKIKVLGNSNAIATKQGTTKTPAWLQNEQWFKQLACSSTNMPIEFEEIKMSKSPIQENDVLIQDYQVDYESEDLTTSDDESNLKLNRQSALLQHAKSVKMQTYQALKDGFYPIVLGGDNTQGLGSVPAMKQYMPQAKLLWIDSSEEPSQTNMTLAKLSGRSVPEGYTQLSCLKDRDITIFGQADIDLSTKQELVFGAQKCKSTNMMEINTLMSRYFQSQGQSLKYWISFDASSLNPIEFKSTQKKNTQSQGVSVDFMMEFFKNFTPNSIGMDLTEVNFEKTWGACRHNDQQTLRELIEQICHQVNQPAYDQDFIFESEDQKHKF